MLSLLISCSGFHAPAGPFHAESRTRTLLASEEAKRAWLAKNPPSWGFLGRDTKRAPDVSEAAQAINSPWLVPGPSVLTLEAADHMTNVALRECASGGFNPVSVCVLDPAGRTIVQKTMIGCGGLSPALALAKASTCIGLHCSSRELRDKYINNEGTGPKMPQALTMAIIGANAWQPVATFPGGVLCRDATQNVVCAIGVSGAASDEDEHCAIKAAQSVGLVTEPAFSQLG